MVQSLELIVDDETDRAVRLQWELLAAAGLPSQARHTGASNAPHVTLAVAGSVPAAVEGALGVLAEAVPLEIRLGGVLCFPARGGARQVLARLVVPSRDLLALHAAAASMFADLPGSPPYLGVGAWTPHVTLARNVPTEQVGLALTALGAFGDLTGTAVALRRWDSDVRETWVV